ncbi:MAG: roadblock/LC7 domain-containing protein [Euryarchaeota archaeon]|nr:roadblock/LC7 domain-containing protein [Euryarchaeota archaeon]
MTMQAKEAIDKILHDLNNIRGIEASAALSRDGLLVSSTMTRNADILVAMSATMFGAAEVASRELDKGSLNRVIVETKHGLLIASGAGRKALLVVLAKDNSTLGHILLEMSKATEKMIDALENKGV